MLKTCVCPAGRLRPPWLSLPYPSKNRATVQHPASSSLGASSRPLQCCSRFGEVGTRADHEASRCADWCANSANLGRTPVNSAALHTRRSDDVAARYRTNRNSAELPERASRLTGGQEVASSNLAGPTSPYREIPFIPGYLELSSTRTVGDRQDTKFALSRYPVVTRP